MIRTDSGLGTSGRARHEAASLETDGHRAPAAAVWAALLSVWLFWGGTYLAIRLVVRTMPPFLSASIRFLVAGALLYAFAVRRGDREGDRPGRAQWVAATIIGGSLLLGGNGMVMWAEQTVPSGIAALIIASVPLWLALLDRLVFGKRLSWVAVLGLAVGFGGLVLLLNPTGGGTIDPAGAAALVVASLSWAAGSLYARHAPLPKRPLVGTGMEMLAGGLLLALVGAVRGEFAQFDSSSVSLESVLGLGYLIVFGSLVAFAAYVWLLRVTRTTLVSTYAYVNPVVAVFLGWAVLAEPIAAGTLVAGAIIVVAVALIVSARPAKQRAEASPPAEP
ncbi:MAG TPA: EamA family transporter [Actinomycetota bacterium]|nr:EamA family transporter [Actinomycetota bacterium]